MNTGEMSMGSRYAVVFLFALTVALATANLLWTSHLVNKASANAASIVQLCEAANASRTRQITLWTYIISISRPPPHETPAARAQREKTVGLFIAHLHQIFATRNCHKE